MQRTRLYFLIGQTASGKGAAAVALAQEVGAEIISLDSMKVYRGMDVGTAKPPPERRATVPHHHMIDVADPGQHFSTALYVEGAERAIKEITRRRAVPLFAGGTALYLKAMTEGLFEGPPADLDFRSRLRAEAAERGSEHLHRRLAEVDPAAAERIHPNDLRRIERALEVHEKTGTPISELQEQFGRPNEKYAAVIMGLRREKADLHGRINRRVDAMMAAGLLDEVRRLTSAPMPLGREASQSLGYKEMLAHLNGECALDDAVELLKLHTRQFAKAQMTWFKRMENVEWFDVAPDETADHVAGRLAAFLRDRLST
ncbi:MAG: tRNA (adenosine(37)-N6)-dimethylallyltransferase MiaA [Planctomycetota bacterium]